MEMFDDELVWFFSLIVIRPGVSPDFLSAFHFTFTVISDTLADQGI